MMQKTRNSSRGIRPIVLVTGKELQHRVRVRLRILYARLRARNKRKRHGRNCQPYPRAPVSGCNHLEVPSHIVP